MQEVALFFHLLGALLFTAGIVVAGVAFEAARRRERPAEIALLLSVTRIGVMLVGVGGLLLPIFGLWLVHLGHFGYGSGWVDGAIGLYVVALALGAVGGQRPKQARTLATRLAAEGGDGTVSTGQGTVSTGEGAISTGEGAISTGEPTAQVGERSTPTEELRTLLDDRRARAANYASLGVVIAILVLMVFK